jgi:hypothetical protein
MSPESQVAALLALAVVACLISSLTGRAARAAAVGALVLLLVALLVGWAATPSPHPSKPVTVLAALLAVVGGGLVTPQVFALVEEPDRVRRARSVLRGGAWIGALERIGVFVAVVVGWGTGVAIVLAVKGLGRYPELRNQDDSGVAERFIIGTFVSVLWAVACAGVAVLTP